MRLSVKKITKNTAPTYHLFAVFCQSINQSITSFSWKWEWRM